MFNIITKQKIKTKILLITLFGIFFLILVAAGNMYTSAEVKDRFGSLNKNELSIKDQTNLIISYISKLNQHVTFASVTDEVTKKTIALSIKYDKLILKELNDLTKIINKQTNNKKAIKLLTNIKKRYTIYSKMALDIHLAFKEDFDDGIDELFGLDAISKKMNSELASLSEISTRNFNIKVKDTYNFMNLSSKITLIVSIITILFFTFFTRLLGASIVTSIEKFQNGLLEFFKYLNRKTQDIEFLDTSYRDEIANMAKVINKNIKKIQTTMEEDKLFLEDTDSVMHRVEHGWFSQSIVAKTNNPALIELKKTINKALIHLKDGVLDINQTLDSYANYDYRKLVIVDDIEKDGVFDKLIIGINSLRDVINVMLIDNKSVGLALNNGSDTLLNNSKKLDKNSNEAASSLKSIASTLENVTKNISSNTTNVVKMSNFANQLNKSAIEGQNLANKTTESMTKIDEQINSINEAITVIDQIAFQTNILSLNAAVEAATAGEAGKGFAVVAQEVRNLANKSAEAAKEIQNLVEDATAKANEGKYISDKMIEGYNDLNNNVSQTLELILDVEKASREQQGGIIQINDAVNALDQKTQQNASIASQSYTVSIETDKMAKLVISSADEKEFNGKNEVEAKQINID